MAKTVECHHSILYRELRCCGTKGQCSPDTAQQLAKTKRANASKYRIPKERVDFMSGP
ncbi:MAG: hypothetical protein ACTH6E_06385 [Vibrio litoralis]